jgi:serine/threonine-protein kinase Chk2
METDMCKYINKKKHGYLNEELCRMITYQLIVAVRYLHGNNCSHLDIKCENILISLLKPIPDKPGEIQNREYPLVKLADFGYSRIIGEHSFRKTRVGTVR